VHNLLKEIVHSKQEHIERLRLRFPENDLQVNVSPRSLSSALTAAHPSFILECKPASPSAGLLRERVDLPSIVDVYNRYANAISVLTDEDYFGGRFEYIAIVRKKTSLPILCKDFIVDPYQVKLAGHLGADAVLLMLSVLSDRQYSELAGIANERGLQILTEVGNPHELERALTLGARIVGINNRDLCTMKVDVTNTIRLAPLIGDGVVVISESGISHRRQVLELAPKVNGFLIGSALMAAHDLESACAHLVRGRNRTLSLKGQLA